MTPTLHVLNPFSAAEIYRTNASRNLIVSPMRETYSQHGEDLIIASLLEIQLIKRQAKEATIRYVDIGANHPIEISNTYLFYRVCPWAHGVLFEADPSRIEELTRIRPRDRVVHAAITDLHQKQVTLHLANATECSSIQPERMAGIPGLEYVDKVTVPNLHVMDAFEQYWPSQDVQLLSIDIECKDADVVKAIDWQRYRPWILCVEVSPRDMAQSIIEHMQAAGYQPTALTADNLIFVDAA